MELVPARITTVTLGARNVKKLRDFYAQLGWPILVDSDDFVAFHTKGALLVLFALRDLEADVCARANAPETGLRGRVTKEPVDATFFNGRSAYSAAERSARQSVA
jgi:uncharacterized protein